MEHNEANGYGSESWRIAKDMQVLHEILQDPIHKINSESLVKIRYITDQLNIDHDNVDEHGNVLHPGVHNHHDSKINYCGSDYREVDGWSYLLIDFSQDWYCMTNRPGSSDRIIQIAGKRIWDVEFPSKPCDLYSVTSILMDFTKLIVKVSMVQEKQVETGLPPIEF
jgi:hypothetical protein